jgi:hypothetical protein
MTAEQMTALRELVLLRFAVELAEAGPAQLEHLAQRAEARYTTDLGDCMRALVDLERGTRLEIQRREIETAAATNRYRTWVR